MRTRRYSEEDVRDTQEWLRSKGCSVWPTLPDGDLTDETECENIARWFMDQCDELNEFMFRKRYS